MKKLNKRGFTLIELMVVVAIMAVLASVGFVSYGAVKKKGNDSKRKADLNNIMTTIEMLKNDSAAVSTAAAACTDNMFADSDTDDICAGNSISNGNDVLIPSLPDDPTTTQHYKVFYTNGTDGPITDYCISAPMEAVANDTFKCLNGSCSTVPGAGNPVAPVPCTTATG